MKEILRFQEILISKNVTALLRKSRGGDELAACGQLGKV
jgi:adenine C2-methylase RlmN of 23S rRNA A2503 and tRNA A37